MFAISNDNMKAFKDTQWVCTCTYEWVMCTALDVPVDCSLLAVLTTRRMFTVCSRGKKCILNAHPAN